MRSMIFVAVSSLALAACGMQGQDNDSESDTAVAARGSTDLGYDTYGSDNLADTMASNDDAPNSAVVSSEDMCAILALLAQF